ncbi:hypothetical protein ACC685_39225, partial [Rhizobium ruizarguesonis]
GKYGVGSISNLAMLIGTFYVTSLLFVFIVLGAFARYNGFSIVALLRYIKEELLPAFSILFMSPGSAASEDDVQSTSS